jgi:hypothetical protein
VKVYNPPPGGGLSNGIAFTVNNPLPTITTLSPSSETAGGPAFTLTVNGTNFVNNSIVRWNSLNRTTNYISSIQLTASIESTDIASAGICTVKVYNPTPGGGLSNPIIYHVIPPAPTLLYPPDDTSIRGSFVFLKVDSFPGIDSFHFHVMRNAHLCKDTITAVCSLRVQITVDSLYSWCACYRCGCDSGPFCSPWEFNVLPGIEEISNTLLIPTEFMAENNYPNPFNIQTSIKYALPKNCQVNLQVYNSAGILVRTLKTEKEKVGFYRVIWNGCDDKGKRVAKGIYFYRLHASEFTTTKKMVLLK